MDAATHAGRPAGPAGHLDERHHHALRTTRRARRESVSDRKGSGRAGSTSGGKSPWIVLRPPATPAPTTSSGSTAGRKSLARDRTSLVVDPPDGRVPLRPEAEAKRDYDLAHNADSYEHMSVWDRCITRGVPGGMFPAGYNNAYQIVQIPGYVVILYEMIHEARMIPLDGRPHPPSSVAAVEWRLASAVGKATRWWSTPPISTARAGSRPALRPDASRAFLRATALARGGTLHARRCRHDQLRSHHRRSERLHETLESGHSAEQGSGLYVIYEYACHEGNTAVANILAGGRARDKAAEQVARKGTR